jgi:ketosteroid isomerase-like protein
VEAHGETATEVGTFSIRDAGGKEVDRGKYVAVWKRVQGQWKMHREIWNSSLPVQAPR